MTSHRTNWCRHHKRVYIPHLGHECALGIDIEKLTTDQCGVANFGRHYMLPCHNSTAPDTKKAVCDKCSLFTEAEIAAEDAEREEWTKKAVARLESTLPLLETIKKLTRESKGDRRGSNPCPACENGTVTWACAYFNGHVRMRCSTEDCINFME